MIGGWTEDSISTTQLSDHDTAPPTRRIRSSLGGSTSSKEAIIVADFVLCLTSYYVWIHSWADFVLCVCLTSYLSRLCIWADYLQYNLPQWATTITNPTEGALTQLKSLCRILRIFDVFKVRHRFANILLNACLNHPTISCWTRMTPKPHT